ncbi:hypothetical protein AAG906_035047 [Vitis piasezkii]
MMMTPTLRHEWRHGFGEPQDESIDGENESEESKQIDEERRQKHVDKDIEAIVVHLIGEIEGRPRRSLCVSVGGEVWVHQRVIREEPFERLLVERSKEFRSL